MRALAALPRPVVCLVPLGFERPACVARLGDGRLEGFAFDLAARLEADWEVRVRIAEARERLADGDLDAVAWRLAGEDPERFPVPRGLSRDLVRAPLPRPPRLAFCPDRTVRAALRFTAWLPRSVLFLIVFFFAGIGLAGPSGPLPQFLVELHAVQLDDQVAGGRRCDERRQASRPACDSSSGSEH